jgi:hypothetical protein
MTVADVASDISCQIRHRCHISSSILYLGLAFMSRLIG